MKYALMLYAVALFSSLVLNGSKPIDKFENLQSDSLLADWDRHISNIQNELGDKVSQPTDSVFGNIKTMKGMPAKRLLAIMKFGYSRSLGVGCGHCHNTSKWESDEKPEKEIARQMSMMTRKIRLELLAEIEGLKSDEPAVNCTTCHRGQVKPALNLKE